jgi:hypothetical protein
VVGAAAASVLTFEVVPSSLLEGLMPGLPWVLGNLEFAVRRRT